MERSEGVDHSELRRLVNTMGVDDGLFVSRVREDVRGVVLFDVEVHRAGRGLFLSRCGFCDRAFEGKLARALFCSTTCRQRAHRAAKVKAITDALDADEVGMSLASREAALGKETGL